MATARKLGAALEVFPVGLGCMGMSAFYGRRDDRQSIGTLHRAIERGVTLLDTADIYGNGENEALIGRALRAGGGLRERVVVATKFGCSWDLATGARGPVIGRPDYVRRAAEDSLARLGIDRIDLLYQHRVDPDVPIEETVGAMGELVRRGLVRHLGLCEAAIGTVRRAHAVHPITAVQAEYSLWSRDPEDGLLAACRALGIGVVAYSPLGRGFLTGAIAGADDLDADDSRRNHPRFQEEHVGRNLGQVGEVKRLAAAKGCTPAQLLLAWVLAQGEDIVPIPGTRRPERVDENLGALDVRLTAEDFRGIERVLGRGSFSGARYPDSGMRAVDL